MRLKARTFLRMFYFVSSLFFFLISSDCVVFLLSVIFRIYHCLEHAKSMSGREEKRNENGC